MSLSLSRRRMLLAAGASMFGLESALRRSWAQVAKGTPKRILFFTKSAGFEHSVIARKGDQIGHAERIFVELGKEHGFEIVPSKDGRLFSPDAIGQWDGFAFYTTGVLTEPGNDKQPPMTPDGKKAFLDAVAGGKGFVGFHSATDSFHSQGDEVDPYIRLIGGEFISHGPQQVAIQINHDTAFPGAAPLGEKFEINDEWYTQKNLADDLHVILAQQTEGMQGEMYRRPSYPSTWARVQDKGRVFYSSMGHREDVWENAKYQGLILGGLLWATGLAEAQVSPNVSQVTPGFKQLGA
jgi:type 1 glutamine amidotransferase